MSTAISDTTSNMSMSLLHKSPQLHTLVRNLYVACDPWGLWPRYQLKTPPSCLARWSQKQPCTRITNLEFTELDSTKQRTVHFHSQQRIFLHRRLDQLSQSMARRIFPEFLYSTHFASLLTSLPDPVGGLSCLKQSQTLKLQIWQKQKLIHSLGFGLRFWIWIWLLCASEISQIQHYSTKSSMGIAMHSMHP